MRNLIKPLFVVCALIALAVIASCQPMRRVEPQVASGVRFTVPSFEWRVLDEETLQKQCRDYTKPLLRDTHKFVGCVGWNLDTGRKVVYTLPPKYVDGPETMTLGHEVMHVALGDFHK